MALTIRLEIGGKKKTFTALAPKARIVRTTMEITEKVDEEDMNTALLDEMVSLVVSVFGNKFTADNMWDGIDANNFMPEILRIVEGIGDSLNEKVIESPNVQTVE